MGKFTDLLNVRHDKPRPWNRRWLRQLAKRCAFRTSPPPCCYYCDFFLEMLERHPPNDVEPAVVSDRKLEAKRHNAQLSTGPRTERGKKYSRRNALKRGIFASTLLVQEVEDAGAFKKLLECLREHFKPNNEMEEVLVERLAILLWKQRRSLSWEAEMIRHRPLGSELHDALNQADGTNCLGLPAAAKLDLLLRYEASVHAQIRFVLRELDHQKPRRNGANGSEMQA